MQALYMIVILYFKEFGKAYAFTAVITVLAQYLVFTCTCRNLAEVKIYVYHFRRREKNADSTQIFVF